MKKHFADYLNDDPRNPGTVHCDIEFHRFIAAQAQRLNPIEKLIYQRLITLREKYPHVYGFNIRDIWSNICTAESAMMSLDQLWFHKLITYKYAPNHSDQVIRWRKPIWAIKLWNAYHPDNQIELEQTPPDPVPVRRFVTVEAGNHRDKSP